MKTFRKWMVESAVAANSTLGGGIDGIGPDIKVGKGAGKDGDSTDIYDRTDKFRAGVRSALLHRLGMTLDDIDTKSLYDQPEPYPKAQPFAQKPGTSADYN